MALLRRNCEKTVTGEQLTQELQTRIYKLESDEAASGRGAPATKKMESRRVLVVEDEKNIRDLVCLHLGVEGYECVPVADGKEAMLLASEKTLRPDHPRFDAARAWTASPSRARSAGTARTATRRF